MGERGKTFISLENSKSASTTRPSSCISTFEGLMSCVIRCCVVLCGVMWCGVVRGIIGGVEV
jgi:hypothetical protein